MLNRMISSQLNTTPYSKKGCRTLVNFHLIALALSIWRCPQSTELLISLDVSEHFARIDWRSLQRSQLPCNCLASDHCATANFSRLFCFDMRFCPSCESVSKKRTGGRSEKVKTRTLIWSKSVHTECAAYCFSTCFTRKRLKTRSTIHLTQGIIQLPLSPLFLMKRKPKLLNIVPHVATRILKGIFSMLVNHRFVDFWVGESCSCSVAFFVLFVCQFHGQASSSLRMIDPCVV